jgi:6-pyruvoyl-tetrahydropterin synthase
MKITQTVRVPIHVAHSVKTIERCAPMHGHTMTIEIELATKLNVEQGWDRDFTDIKAAIRGLGLDHSNLNDILGDNATAELLAMYVSGQLGMTYPGQVVRVTVWETEHASATAWCGA